MPPLSCGHLPQNGGEFLPLPFWERNDLSVAKVRVREKRERAKSFGKLFLDNFLGFADDEIIEGNFGIGDVKGAGNQSNIAVSVVGVCCCGNLLSVHI